MNFFLCLVALVVGADEKSRAIDPPHPKKVVQLERSLAVDINNKLVIVDAEVVFREGLVELLLCPKQTKEHESILAAKFQPRTFQTALLLAGALPGKPAQFDPFLPPTGQTLRIWLEYEEGKETKRVDSRTWIRNPKTGAALGAQFVFAGSRLVNVPGADRPVFMGDDGDVVCVANFPGSIIDVGIKSSKENDEALFQAWTERIPPRGTKVRIVIEPLFPENAKNGSTSKSPEKEPRDKP